MRLIGNVTDFLEPWTGSVATAITSALDKAIPSRVVRIVEQGEQLLVEAADGKTTARVSTNAIETDRGLASLLKGTRIEITLDSKHFVFRPVEVPARAAGFLEGIVRAQIDRLTPWNANEAVFGCSPPTRMGGGEMIVTVVAVTTRKIVEKYVQPLNSFHPAAISIWTKSAGHEIERLKVFEQNARQRSGASLLNRSLKAAFGIGAIVAVLSILSATFLANYLGDQEEELGNRLMQQRAKIRANGATNDQSPIAILRRRKLDAVPAVFILDKLSAVLPDNTYVTELHLADNKVQIVGISADASSLIPLIEQSEIFKSATFFAPTTTSASDRGERFHIEAQIEARAKANQ